MHALARFRLLPPAAEPHVLVGGHREGFPSTRILGPEPCLPWRPALQEPHNVFKGPTAPDSINHLTKLNAPILFIQVSKRGTRMRMRTHLHTYAHAHGLPNTQPLHQQRPLPVSCALGFHLELLARVFLCAIHAQEVRGPGSRAHLAGHATSRA